MKQKKRDKRLSARIKEYTDTVNGGKWQESKVAQRAATGGYHKPGSKGRR